MFTDLHKKIVSMLAAGTAQETTVQDFESSEITGSPAITVTPSANENEYWSDKDNVRVYAFTVRLWVNRTALGDREAEHHLRDLVDSVLNLFDAHYTLGSGSPGDALNIPTGYAMIRTEASPSAWFYIDREQSYRMAEITLRCHVHADVTLISST